MSMNKKTLESTKAVTWAKKGAFWAKNTLNQPLTGLNPSKYLEQL